MTDSFCSLSSNCVCKRTSLYMCTKGMSFSSTLTECRTTSVTSGIIIVFFCIIAYRIFFHPLAKYRGPLLARISSWPDCYHAAIGDRHVWLLRLHSQYGPNVRFSPNSISFNTLSAVDSIYTARDANVIKGDWYQCVRDSAGGFESTFTARSKSRHALKRRILAHAFSERALRDYEPRIKRLTEIWLQHLAERSQAGLSVDFGAQVNYLIFDILGDLCYSEDFGLVGSEKDRYVTALLPRTTRSWYILGYHPWTHFLRWLLFKTPLKTNLGRSIARNNSKFRAFCVQALMERVKQEKSQQQPELIQRDMFHHLLKARDPETGEGFSKGDLGAESVLLMIAGTHTTSVAIAAIVCYLSKNETVLEKVTAEVCETLPCIADLSYRNLSSLPYLKACINEALRLCPPTAGHLQREILQGGAEIDGVLYPMGTNVGVSAYALQRNPHIWTRPDEYIPERWLKADGTFDPRHQAALIAFSSGPLGCPGKQLAYMEMFIVIGSILHQFEIASDKREIGPEDYVLKDCYVGQAAGPQVCLKARAKLMHEKT